MTYHLPTIYVERSIQKDPLWSNWQHLGYGLCRFVKAHALKRAGTGKVWLSTFQLMECAFRISHWVRELTLCKVVLLNPLYEGGILLRFFW